MHFPNLFEPNRTPSQPHRTTRNPPNDIPASLMTMFTAIGTTFANLGQSVTSLAGRVKQLLVSELPSFVSLIFSQTSRTAETSNIPTKAPTVPPKKTLYQWIQDVRTAAGKKSAELSQLILSFNDKVREKATEVEKTIQSFKTQKEKINYRAIELNNQLTDLKAEQQMLANSSPKDDVTQLTETRNTILKAVNLSFDTEQETISEASARLTQKIATEENLAKEKISALETGLQTSESDKNKTVFTLNKKKATLENQQTEKKEQLEQKKLELESKKNKELETLKKQTEKLKQEKKQLKQVQEKLKEFKNQGKLSEFQAEAQQFEKEHSLMSKVINSIPTPFSRLSQTESSDIEKENKNATTTPTTSPPSLLGLFTQTVLQKKTTSLEPPGKQTTALSHNESDVKSEREISSSQPGVRSFFAKLIIRPKKEQPNTEQTQSTPQSTAGTISNTANAIWEKISPKPQILDEKQANAILEKLETEIAAVDTKKQHLKNKISQAQNPYDPEIATLERTMDDLSSNINHITREQESLEKTHTDKVTETSINIARIREDNAQTIARLTENIEQLKELVSLTSLSITEQTTRAELVTKWNLLAEDILNIETYTNDLAKRQRTIQTMKKDLARTLNITETDQKAIDAKMAETNEQVTQLNAQKESLEKALLDYQAILVAQSYVSTQSHLENTLQPHTYSIPTFFTPEKLKALMPDELPSDFTCPTLKESDFREKQQNICL